MRYLQIKESLDVTRRPTVKLPAVRRETITIDRTELDRLIAQSRCQSATDLLRRDPPSSG